MNPIGDMWMLPFHSDGALAKITCFFLLFFPFFACSTGGEIKDKVTGVPL